MANDSILTRSQMESDLSCDDNGTKFYTETTFQAALNTITQAVELLKRTLNDGDCVADALATVFENTLQVAEWNETRKALKAFLARHQAEENPHAQA